MFILGCKSSKDVDKLKDEKSALESQLSERQTKLTSMETTLATAQADLKSAKQQLEVAKSVAAKSEACESNLASVRSKFNAMQEKLHKINMELKGSFPNNMGEANFSIVEEDGRLVISLPNQILYKRGQADFDANAQKVLGTLSEVFRNNPGMQIIVEGHTDDVPLKAGGMYKDNWDLSMARSVKVVRQLEAYGVHPARLTAAGRGYFSPKSKIDSEEARALNRRTEIIIRPKLTDIMNIMEGVI
jgi:chemotaxis protein MotB